jgi:hypothetical protein
MWVLVYLMETPPLMGDVVYKSFPPHMPLVEALQPISLPQGPYYVVLAFPSFLCVIMTFISILACPIRASRAYGSTISSIHVESMS